MDFSRIVLLLSTAFLFAGFRPARAQIAETPNDATGVSIPYPLIHLVHSRDASPPGTTGDFSRRDPFLLYQLGRDLLNRQYQLSHGVYGRPGELSIPLYINDPEGPQHGALARIARDHASSCGFCHSIPYREPGGGQTIGSTGAVGRNSSHFYGAGLVEMIGEQIRQKIFVLYDTDRDGRFSREEVAGPRPVRIEPLPGAPAIDLGDLSPGPDGVPRLNSLFRVWYVDAQGAVVQDAYGLDDPRVAGFNVAVEVFGWGRGWRRVGSRRVSQGGEAATIRGFFTSAADVHMGIQAHDPSQQARRNGLGARSLAGAQQYALGGSVDRGLRLAPTGLSLDDPDRDGHPSELTEGDIDAVEFYMLHAPAPAVRGTPRSEEGRLVMQETGCTRCHVEDWQIEARDEARGLTGDRRLFELRTSSRAQTDGTVEIVGALAPLWERLASGEYVPRGGAYRVERIYSDFKHWDLGPEFHERRFDATLQREHRTAPLWGVGSTAPYGHGGQFPTLDAVIQAHGGEARKESEAYRQLDARRRQRLLEYLGSLVLYSTDEIRSDIDGDGVLADVFQVAGTDVGYERFDARFLLVRPPRFRSVGTAVTPSGQRKVLALIDNVVEAFALDLPARRDSDRDGFPDVLDPAPQSPGIEESPAGQARQLSF
ncbi:MAG TPA: di-heme oxidoredictase family protein [Thermoanaerobaculia bacterium]|nr:di-heme oxidoredictase family protein [Thermoanaerobaculia bacterium]